MSQLKLTSLFILCLVQLFFQLAIAKPKLTIAVAEYPPYTSAFLPDHGISSKIVKEAFSLQGYDVEYLFMSAARAYRLAELGTVDATLPWAKRPGRETSFMFGQPVMSGEAEVFFYIDKHFNWNQEQVNYKNIQGLNIAALRGNNYGEAFQTAERNKIINVMRVAELKQGFKLLLDGRVDAVITKKTVGLWTLKQNFTPNQRQQVQQTPEFKQAKSDEYLLISKLSKQSDEIFSAMNKGLKKLRASGQYEKIIQQYK